MIYTRRYSPLAYLTRYGYAGQHRAARPDLAERRAAALRRHPAGTRLNLAGATTS